MESTYSETDEEDDDDVQQLLGLSSAKKKSSQHSRTSPGKASESMESPLAKKKTIRREMDHLSLFKRKMTKRFRKEKEKLSREQSQSQMISRRDNDYSQSVMISRRENDSS